MQRVNLRLFKQLYHFLVVAENKKFSKAASILCMSQPPLSQSISNLEKTLGYPLFERHSRGVELTPAGAILYPLVRECITLTRELTQTVEEFNPKVKDQLSVVAVYNAMLVFIPRLKAVLKKRNKSISIFAGEEKTGDMEKLLLANSADLAIGYLSSVDSPKLCIQSIAKAQIKVLVSENHPLTKYPAVPVSELKGLPLAVLNRTSSPQYFDQILYLFKKHHIKPLIRHEVASIHSLLGFAACNQGVVLFVECAPIDWPSGLKAIKINDEEASITLSVIWKKDHESKALKDVLFAIQEVPKTKQSAKQLES